MELKIFLTGDNHIGLKFSNYPDQIKQELIEARINNLRKMVETANEQHCDLFIIAGDLFDKVKIARKDIEKAGGRMFLEKLPFPIMPGIITTGEVPRVTDFENTGTSRRTVQGDKVIDDIMLDDMSLIINIKN